MAPTPAPVELFCDDMSDINTWTISDSKHIEDANHDDRCSEPEDTCIRVRGYRNEDCYLKRSYANLYTSYTLKFDIVLYDMEDPNYCRIHYSFDDNTYTELKFYQGGDGTTQLLDQTFSFDNTNIGSSQVYIKLETDGDSWFGDDSCYYDNVCLYGQGLVTTAVPTPNPLDTTSSPTGSTPSPTTNTQPPTQVTSSPTQRTPSPTANTQSPTIVTSGPTMVPALDPTTDPTSDPTIKPTMDPTSDPTLIPSNNPSLYPTSITPLPSSSPSSVPTSFQPGESCAVFVYMSF